jgi:hypothetical protein
VTIVRGALAVRVLVGVVGEAEGSPVGGEIVGVALAGVTPGAVGCVAVATGVGPGGGTQATRGETIKIKKGMNTTRKMFVAFCNCACFDQVVHIFVVSSTHSNHFGTCFSPSPGDDQGYLRVIGKRFLSSRV